MVLLLSGIIAVKLLFHSQILINLSFIVHSYTISQFCNGDDIIKCYFTLLLLVFLLMVIIIAIVIISTIIIMIIINIIIIIIVIIIPISIILL